MSAVKARRSVIVWTCISLALLVVATTIVRGHGFVSQSKAPGARPDALKRFAAMPLYFERNQGQSDPSVRFIARQGNYAVFLTDDAAVFSFVGLRRHGA